MLALTIVVDSKDQVITRASEDLVGAEQLNTLAESRISDYRAYLLNGSQENLNLTNAGRTRFLDQVRRLQATLTDPTELSLLNAVSAAEAEHAAAAGAGHRSGAGRSRTCRTSRSSNSTNKIRPAREKLEKAIADLNTRASIGCGGGPPGVLGDRGPRRSSWSSCSARPRSARRR